MSRTPAPDTNQDPEPGVVGPDDLTDAEVDTIVARVCETKRPFDDPADACELARVVRARTAKPMRAYRCPFSGGTRALGHWHIGRVPSLRSLRLIAAAIRHRAQRTAR